MTEGRRQAEWLRQEDGLADRGAPLDRAVGVRRLGERDSLATTGMSRPAAASASDRVSSSRMRPTMPPRAQETEMRSRMMSLVASGVASPDE